MSTRPSAFSEKRLLEILESLPAVNAYFVGFSGGADSTALLHALNALRDRLETTVSAIHINHGLNADSNLWQAHCKRFCERLGVPFLNLDIEPGNNTGKGLEAESRQLRYAAIESVLEDGDCLLTAHHADDQAETLLLNLMRGSGVDGLAAMPGSRPFGSGLLQRPLLGFQGAALRDYLLDCDVEWIEDPSNQLLDHDRNLVRHEIIPLLEKRWPNVSKRLLLTQRAMSGARRLLENLADEQLSRQLAHPLVLRVSLADRADPELFKLVTRRWLRNADFPSIPVYRLDSLYQQVCQASAGHRVSIAWDGCSLRYFQHQLWLGSEEQLSSMQACEWTDVDSGCDLGPDAGQLFFSGPVGDKLEGRLTVDTRSSLSETGIVHCGHRKSLKNIYQSACIPPWLRDHIPLCSLDGELIAVGDWLFSDRFAALQSGYDVQLKWKPRNPLLQFVRAQQNHR